MQRNAQEKYYLPITPQCILAHKTKRAERQIAWINNSLDSKGKKNFHTSARRVSKNGMPFSYPYFLPSRLNLRLLMWSISSTTSTNGRVCILDQEISFYGYRSSFSSNYCLTKSAIAGSSFLFNSQVKLAEMMYQNDCTLFSFNEWTSSPFFVNYIKMCFWWNKGKKASK